MAKDNEKKDAKKVANKKVQKEPYLKSVRNEMKLVKWPTWKEVLKYTIATVVLCLIVCLFFLLLNFILSFIKGRFA